MKILLTNDDGINAEGLYSLYKSVKSLGDVIVVAPDTERSAVGHAITLSDPLRAAEVTKRGEFYGYAINGTPADCVKIAVQGILDYTPDLVISGINLGSNSGINVIYSGTVSAATEGSMLGIPSIAVSLATFLNPDFTYAAKFARKMAETVISKGLPDGTLLNVNIPNIPESEIAGVEVTRQGMAVYSEDFDKRIDPWGRTYYWMSGEREEIEEEGNVDDRAIEANKVSVTPMQFDMTDYKNLDVIKSWELVK